MSLHFIKRSTSVFKAQPLDDPSNTLFSLGYMTFSSFRYSAHIERRSITNTFIKGISSKFSDNFSLVNFHPKSTWKGYGYLKYCIFHLAQVNEELLSVGKLERYKKTIQTASTGKLISDVVLQTLNKAERKQGMTGDAYLMEEQHYEEAMNTVFHNLMVGCIYYTMKPILVPGRGPGHPDP